MLPLRLHHSSLSTLHVHRQPPTLRKVSRYPTAFSDTSVLFPGTPSSLRCIHCQKLGFSEIRACHPNTSQRDLCPSPARHSSPHLDISWSAYLVTHIDETPRLPSHSAFLPAMIPIQTPFRPHCDPPAGPRLDPGWRYCKGPAGLILMTLEINCLNLLPKSFSPTDHYQMYPATALLAQSLGVTILNRVLYPSMPLRPHNSVDIIFPSTTAFFFPAHEKVFLWPSLAQFYLCLL